MTGKTIVYGDMVDGVEVKAGDLVRFDNIEILPDGVMKIDGIQVLPATEFVPMPQNPFNVEGHFSINLEELSKVIGILGIPEELLPVVTVSEKKVGDDSKEG